MLRLIKLHFINQWRCGDVFLEPTLNLANLLGGRGIKRYGHENDPDISSICFYGWGYVMVKI